MKFQPAHHQSLVHGQVWAHTDIYLVQGTVMVDVAKHKSRQLRRSRGPRLLGGAEWQPTQPAVPVVAVPRRRSVLLTPSAWFPIADGASDAHRARRQARSFGAALRRRNREWIDAAGNGGQ